uniref:Serum amyloid A protein n=1 Tax=Pelusios castaneus TaxID=367368 RepID=A0A8C8REQ2_9SAUR
MSINVAQNNIFLFFYFSEKTLIDQFWFETKLAFSDSTDLPLNQKKSSISSPVYRSLFSPEVQFLGAGDMWRAYDDMRDANYKNADKYFHARGNYDAAQRGPGGAWAAKVISDAREGWQDGISGRGAEDTRLDQEANEWGRSGRDPNHYRPAGLPEKY